MPRVCTVCSHPDRLAIDTAIVSGASNRRIGAQWKLQESSIRRHKEHMQRLLQPAQSKVESAHRKSLEERLYEAHATLDEAQALARESGDPDLLVKAVSARSKLLALEHGSLVRTVAESREQWQQLTPEQKRERLALMEQRLSQARAELDNGGGLQ